MFVTARATVQGWAGFCLRRDAPAFRGDKGAIHAPERRGVGPAPPDGGLEQAQNAQRLSGSRKEADRRLREIMSNIHTKCARCGEKNGYVNYVDGANIAGF